MSFPYTKDFSQPEYDEKHFSNQALKEAQIHRDRIQKIRAEYLKTRDSIEDEPMLDSKSHSQPLVASKGDCLYDFTAFKRDKDLPIFFDKKTPDQFNSSKYFFKDPLPEKSEPFFTEKVSYSTGTNETMENLRNNNRIADNETFLARSDETLSVNNFSLNDDLAVCRLSVILEKTESAMTNSPDVTSRLSNETVKTVLGNGKMPIIITTPENSEYIHDGSVKEGDEPLSANEKSSTLLEDDTLKSLGYSSLKSSEMYIAPYALQQHRATSENYLYPDELAPPELPAPISPSNSTSKITSRSRSAGNEQMLNRLFYEDFAEKRPSLKLSDVSKSRNLPPTLQKVNRRYNECDRNQLRRFHTTTNERPLSSSKPAMNSQQRYLSVNSMNTLSREYIYQDSPNYQSNCNLYESYLEDSDAEDTYDGKTNSPSLNDQIYFTDDEDSYNEQTKPHVPKQPSRRQSKRNSVSRSNSRKRREDQMKITPFQRTSFIDQIRRLSLKRDKHGDIMMATRKLFTDILLNDNDLAEDVSSNLNSLYPVDVRHILNPIVEKLKKAKLEEASEDAYLEENERLYVNRMNQSDNQNRKPLAYRRTLNSSNVHLDSPHLGIAPAPIPPATTKSQIMPNEARLAWLDAKAIEISNSIEYTTFPELIKALANDCTNDVEICRSLYRWTTHRNFNLMNVDRTGTLTNLELFEYNIARGISLRNEIFFELCKYASIYCEYIVGISKGAGYKPGMSFSIKTDANFVQKPASSSVGGLFSNTWLAVYVGGGWRFVNCNWGSRWRNCPNQTSDLDRMRPRKGHYYSQSSLSDVNNTSDEYREDSGYSPKKSPLSMQTLQCDEFYFLTDPDQHIFEHFPDKKRWQLLKKPIKLERFSRLPLLKSPFFNAGLQLAKNYSDTIETKKGKVSVKILMNKFVGLSCGLENRSDNSLIRGLCLVEYSNNPNTDGTLAQITVTPNQVGSYYLNIYISEDWRREEDRELCCSFMINCNENNYSRLVTVGRIPDIGFLGATPMANIYSVSLVPHGIASKGHPYIVYHGHKAPNAIIPTSSSSNVMGSVKIPFIISPGLKVSHQLKSFDRPGLQMADCDNFAILQMPPSSQSSKTSNAAYHLRVPVPAFYYLTIYASFATDPLAENLECVWRILIDARKSTPPTAINHQLKKPFVPSFPRQTYWWVNCNLIQPTSQSLTLDKKHTFLLDIPHCSAVAVVINQNDWHYLTPLANRPDRWFAKIHIGNKLGDLSVYGKFIKSPLRKINTVSTTNSQSSLDENAFVKLLDYVIVP